MPGCLPARHFYKAVFVCNTLAFGWPDASSDIDLFVVARRNRLFTTRFFLTLLAQLAGRRRHGEHVAGRLCLSFFVDERAKNLHTIALPGGDPYLAFWLQTLQPVFGSAGKIHTANAWAGKAWPTLSTRAASSSRKNWLGCLLEKVLSGRCGNWIEARLASVQLAKIKRSSAGKKRSLTTAVIANKQMLKFHESDARARLKKEWLEK